jgi:bifunctional DNase/RNase
VFRIDARTSDAIALAVRFDAPIYVYESILEKESIPFSTEDKELFRNNTGHLDTIEELKRALQKAIEEEKYELASVLRDKIAQIK